MQIERNTPLTAGPLDWLSRTDNQLIEMRSMLQRALDRPVLSGSDATSLEMLYGIDVPTLSDLRKKLESGEYFPYHTYTIAMDTAKTDFEVLLEGRSLAAWTDGSFSGVGIRLNHPNADVLYLDRWNPIKFQPFWKIYLTLSAQPGKTLQLFAGRTGSTVPEKGTDLIQLLDANGAVVSPIDEATTPVIRNVEMTLADTEYSQALGSQVKRFEIKTRDGSAFRLAFQTGKVATPTNPYLTVPANSSYSEDGLNCASTIYFASGDAGKIIEIVTWE
ncbi:MAG: hypothetical protein ACRKGH_03750 [Dehalogenimonas sp.]